MIDLHRRAKNIELINNKARKMYEIESPFLTWIELMRSHGYISMTILQEEISDLYDVKNPFGLQDILLTVWLDQIINQTNFSTAVWDLAMATLRRNSLVQFGVIEEEVYSVLS